MMLRKKLMPLAIAFSICLTSFAKENKKVTCEDALHACELYVETFDAERRAYKNVIAKQDEKINQLIDDSRTIPWYWYVLGGVVGGIAISKTIK